MRTGGLAGDLGFRCFRPPNKRLQLALPPIGVRPLAVLRGRFVIDGKIVPNSFVQLTPTLLRGAAETHNR